ncbi:hypothetical protein [Ekhidna sp.]|uniref:hypothetical protein n=1 Tax=Ekhidna sp. TaxID=2608089 RepID=UPI003BAD0974
MSDFLSKRYYFVIIPLLFSCQKLKPESVQIPEYPDFKQLMVDQVDFLENKGIRKTVWLEGESETKTIDMDSAKWADELSFLQELNPNQPEYVGAFIKSNEAGYQVLTLGEKESGALKKVKFSRKNDWYSSIQITLHEDKDVYIHHREIEMSFEGGVLNSLQIDGYQKMMLKDTVRFGVEISVD